MNNKIKNRIEKLVMIAGLNTAHDYDGIESEEDMLLYLDALIRHYESLPVELPVIKKPTNQIENQLMVITDQEEIKALNKQLIKLLDEINKRGQLDWASIKVFIKMQQEQISNLTKAFENVVKLAQEQNLI